LSLRVHVRLNKLEQNQTELPIDEIGTEEVLQLPDDQNNDLMQALVKLKEIEATEGNAETSHMPSGPIISVVPEEIPTKAEHEDDAAMVHDEHEIVT
jgi:hypothetical protein